MVRALARRPMRLAELAGELGAPTQASVRARLKALVALRVVAKKGGGMPYAVRAELTGAGRDLLRLVDEIDDWLSRAPGGSLALGGAAAERAVRALAGGWDSTTLHVLATGPQSLTGLDGEIKGFNYPALERRLVALRTAGLVEPAPSGSGRPYRIAGWGREAMEPLLAAVSFERTHMAESTAPLEPIDAEAASLLARTS